MGDNTRTAIVISIILLILFLLLLGLFKFLSAEESVDEDTSNVAPVWTLGPPPGGPGSGVGADYDYQYPRPPSFFDTLIQALIEQAVESQQETQNQMEAEKARAEAETNTNADSKSGQAETQSETTIQSQLQTNQTQAEAETNTNADSKSGQAETQSDTTIQSQLQTNQTQAEAELNSSIAVGDAGLQVDATVQSQLEAEKAKAEAAFNAAITIVGDAGLQVDATVQSQLEAEKAKAEAAFNAAITIVGDAGLQVDATVQSQLEAEKAKVEAAFNAAITIRKPKTRIIHTVLTATRIARMMEGEPIFDQNNQITAERRTWKRTFNKKLAAAFSYSARSVSARSPEWKGVVAKYYAAALKKVQNNIAYRSATAIPRAIDIIARIKIGNRALQIIDTIDTVADVLSVLTTFVDGLLYDPDGEGLDWMPLSKATFDKQAQKMIDSQIEEIDLYNRDLPADELEFKSAYPLIAGPLDVIDIDPVDDAYKYSHGDTEYNQRRVELEVEAVMDKVLKSNAFRSKTIQYCFDGDEDSYTEYVASGESIAEYVNYLPDVDYDEVYNQAYSNVCAYHDGVVYEDTYSGSTRRRFQCGWKDYNACERAAVRWSATSGQVGNYAEWFTFDELRNTKDANPIDASRMTLLKARGKTSACIVTGSGQRSLCEMSKGTYNFQNHSCVMTPETCQSFGTCYDPAPAGQVGGNCYIPKGIDKAQMFFGQSFPREWIRIYGCRTNGANTMEDIGDFLTSGGMKFIADIVANQRNWNKGMKAVFSDPATITNFALIFGALGASAVGFGTGPIMFAIMIVIGSQMADAAVRSNREAAQMPPAEPAEYTVGGWKITNEEPEHAIKQAERLSNGNLKITSKTAVSLAAGDKVSIYRLYYNSAGSVTKQPPLKDASVVSVESSTVFTVSQSVYSTSDFNYTSNPSFVKTVRPIYELRADDRKIPLGIGYVTGWLTKPLRPKNHSGGIVPETGTVKDIAGVYETDCYADVRASNQRAYPHGDGCSPAPSALAVQNLDGKCVNRRIQDNYYWQLETSMTTAVNSATGTIGGLKGRAAINSDNWMDKDEYKRLCSRLEEGNRTDRPEPMIRGWSTSRDNKLWCLPARPPESWADSTIGTLNYAETTYAKNRAWTDGYDPQVPQFSYDVSSRHGNEGLGGTAKYWYYQLVYDPETFNRSLLWNDSVLAEHFLPSTITEMRQYYCNEEFSQYTEDPSSVTLDPKCWGYLAISTSLYNFMPMTILANVTQYMA